MDADEMILRDKDHLPGLLGIDVVEVASGRLVAKLKVAKKHMALNGYLHAGSVITLADSSAGYGCLANLPEGALGFTTVELKCNLMGTVTQGEVVCVASCLHAGRTTQVWECEVRSEASKLLAKFACTQLILYAK
jgi:1,4-dihydroxy-2-naphthoyl-CoA hydrolase